MIGALVTCDATGCGAKAMVVLDEGDVHADVAGQQFVFDSGWINMPNTWKMSELGTFCPAHNRGVG